jgi:stage V sporulation protein B
MQKQSFLRGTFILTVSAFVLRILSFVNGIFLTRLLGAEGIGLLMMAHPILPLVITLTELGLPVAISKLVSEAEAQGNKSKVRQILFVSLMVTGTLSIILTLASFLGAKYIAAIFITDQRAYYAMLAITPIAPIIAISAVLKGYFRGKQHMTAIAVSEVVEHIIQLVSILLLVQLLLPYGVQYAAAGAMISSIIGEAGGLLYILAKYRKFTSRQDDREKKAVYLQSNKQTLKELLHIGLPTTGNGFISSIYRAFLPMLITKSLAVAGVATALATKQYGLLFGCVFPLLFLPSFFTRSLTTALVPAVSEARANDDNKLMHRRMDQAMRLSLFIGAPGTVILFIWAEPLAALIYNAPEAGSLLKILAPIFFLHYFEAPLHAILLGLGKATTAMWNMIITNIFEVAAIVIFTSQLGIHGAAIGFGFGIILISFLNFSSISSSIGFYFDIRNAGKAAVGVILMAICGSGAYSFLQQTGQNPFVSLVVGILIAMLVYVMTLLVMKAFTRNELLRIPALRRLLQL